MTDMQSQCLRHRTESSRAVLVKGAAATAFPQATEAAIALLQQGGNAIDAAVAAAWTLSVCEPSASGLGGQTTLLFYNSNGAARIIDGHSYAPAGVSAATVTEKQQRLGHRACVIPSTPATLEYAQRRYGVLPISASLAPAVRVAREGYAITPLQHRQATWFERRMNVSPAIARLFLIHGAAPPVGHIFRQPELAGTLQRMADVGVEDFYRGSIADAIVTDMQRNGGLLSASDLASFSLPVERDAVQIRYRSNRIVSAPAPGGGQNLLFALKVLERLLPSSTDAADDDAWHEAIALASHCAFREREQRDSQLVWEKNAESIDFLNDAEIEQAAERLLGECPVPLANCSEGPGDTTHLTVADGDGNVVALTQSIQSVFGAKVANPELGFVYNNYLWTCPRYPHPNELRPGCMPQSNAAPTVVLSESKGSTAPVLVLGAAGSRRITSSLLQVISQVLDRGLQVHEALAEPRLHGLLSGKVWIEQPIASERLVARLQRKFREVVVKPPRSFGMGCVQAIQRNGDGTLSAAADPRRDGTGEIWRED